MSETVLDSIRRCVSRRNRDDLEGVLAGEVPHLDAKLARELLDLLRNADSFGMAGDNAAVWRAAAYEMMGEFGLAEGELSRAHFTDPAAWGPARCRIAVLRRLQGNFAGAREAATEVLEGKGSKQAALEATEILAGVHADEAEMKEAQSLLVKAAGLFKKMKDVGGEARVLRRLAEIQMLTGNWSEAVKTADAAMESGRERMGGLTVLARLAARGGKNWDERLKEAAGADGSSEERVKLAAAAEELGSVEMAEAALTAAGEVEPLWRTCAELVKARVAQRKGDAAEANAVVRRMREAAASHSILMKAELAMLDGRIKLAGGNTQAAMMNFNVAVRAYVRAGFLWEQATGHELMSQTYETYGASALAATQAELAETLRNRLRAVESSQAVTNKKVEEDAHLIERVAAGRVSPEFAAEEFCAVMDEAFGRKATVGVITDGTFQFLAGDPEMKNKLAPYAAGRRALEADAPLFRFDLGVEDEGEVWIYLPGEREVRLKPFMQVCALAIETARLRRAEAGRRPMVVAESRVASSLGLLGTGKAMRVVTELIERMQSSRTKIPVLILGESGTGKEVTARAIHRTSPRSGRPFVAFNCGAVEKNLVLSELFGHVKGAFTGADSNAVGLIRTADQGTLFLDEIGDLGMEGQISLLRFLEEAEVRPVGASVTFKADVRIIAATNRNLRTMVEEGLFREDLFYRLNGILIELPPLRERLEDLEILTPHFLAQACSENNRRVHVSQAAFEAMRNHLWPGNVRELRQAIYRAVSLGRDEQVLEPLDLMLEPSVGADDGRRKAVKGARSTLVKTDFSGLTWRQAVQKAQREIILQALEKHGYSYTKTAKALEITFSGFRKRCQELGIVMRRSAESVKP